jgi:hypothetical protein
MTISVAFFLSPEGHLIHVPLNHISTVIADPQRFGLAREEIDTVYEDYGERVGVEGEARKGLLLRIINHGWIRIRRHPNRHWPVTAESLTSAVHGLLRNWAEEILSATHGFGESDQYMPVKISTAEGEFLYSIGDLADGSCPR